MHHRFRIQAITVVTLLLALAAPAWAADLEAQLRRLLRESDLRGTQVSAMVVDLDRDALLAAIDADQPMIPASNMKLLTTAAALNLLGPDFSFTTSLGLLPASQGKTLPSLLIVGDGDPAFGDPVLFEEHGLAVDDLLDAWVQAVADTGHKRFDTLLVDDRVFDRQFVHRTWPTDQLINYWCAQVAGINFYNNLIDILPVPHDHHGAAPRVNLYPFGKFLQTTNRAATGSTDSFWVSREPDSNHFTFHGSVKTRPLSPQQVTLHDPPMFFARLLAQRLADKGIQVDKVARVAADQSLPEYQPLHLVKTALPEVIRRINEDSQNLFAEALIKRMGHALTGQPGSWTNGAAAVRIVLRNRLSPLNTAVVSVADGSGMSRDNRVTTRVLVELLRSLHRDPGAAVIFRDSLAEGGETGTLRKRFDSVEGVVYGKSGYLNGVSALSGYLVLPAEQEGQPPRTVAFSFLFNGFKPPLHNGVMKRLQEKMVRLIEQDLTAPTPLGG